MTLLADASEQLQRMKELEQQSHARMRQLEVPTDNTYYPTYIHTYIHAHTCNAYTHTHAHNNNSNNK